MGPRRKEFEPDQALDDAMQLFWRKGYEATSIQDLVDQLGINRFSLYSTFGGKHDLFLAALDRYRETVVPRMLDAVEKSEDGLSGIRACFENGVEDLAGENGCWGCLILNSTAELAPHDPETAARVKAHYTRMEETFRRALVRAKKRGQLKGRRSLRDLARFLTWGMQSLVLMAKTSPGRRTLARHANMVLSVLE
jgi:TetR/AcrR family transcriptional repressor of nem operon